MTPGWSERVWRLSKEGTWVVLGQGLTILGTLVGVRLLTGQLAPASYGELALGMTLATLLNQTVLGALGSGILRFYAPAAERGELGGYLTAVRGLVGSVTGVVLLLLVVGTGLLVLLGKTDWLPLALAAITYALFTGYASFLGAIQNAARHRGIVAAHQALDAWARFLLAVLLTVALGATSSHAMVGYAAGAAIAAISQYVFFRTTIADRVGIAGTPETWRASLVEYSWPFAVWGVFTWAQVASDRWALAIFATTREVGLYSLLYQIGYYPTSLATTMAMQFVSPIVFQRAGDASDPSRNASVIRMSWWLTGGSLALTAAAFLVGLGFHRQLFRLLAAEEYGLISYLLPWVLLAGGLFAAGQTIALSLLSQMRAREMMVSKIVTALGGIGLNFIGAYYYGVAGIVTASVLFSLSYLAWMGLLINSANVSLAANEASV